MVHPQTNIKHNILQFSCTIQFQGNFSDVDMKTDNYQVGEVLKNVRMIIMIYFHFIIVQLCNNKNDIFLFFLLTCAQSHAP